MTWWIIGTIVLIYVVYTLTAELILHIWHIGVLYRGNSDKRTIALTFDDGPDERYTPQVLKILRENQVKATFFLVGERVEEYPHLVRLIAEEGHEIGSHSYYHRHAFLRTPFGMFRDITRAKQQLEEISGKPLRYYRSPWGAMNWSLVYICKKLKLKLVLWSIRAIDWLPGEYADDVVYRVVHKAHPGAVVLCHDAGGADGAPKNTIAALPRMITELKNLGFSFSTIRDLHFAKESQLKESKSPYTGYPIARRILITIWQVVEVIFTKMYHVLTINAIFRISPANWHHGIREDKASGCVIIRDGAKVIDLHFQNETLITISSANDNRALVKMLRMVKTGLCDLARVLQFHPDYKDAEVIMAMTLMNRGIEMLGFHVEELEESKEKKRLQSYMRFLMGMYHPEGFKRLKEGSQTLSLKLVWMTKEELLERYGQQAQIVSQLKD